jgi:threonine dehydrogenase-like Zn-dependent dehydrogenase
MLLRSKKIDPKLLITHRFKLDHILNACEHLGMPLTRMRSR